MKPQRSAVSGLGNGLTVVRIRMVTSTRNEGISIGTKIIVAPVTTQATLLSGLEESLELTSKAGELNNSDRCRKLHPLAPNRT